jgi:DNA replication licensing factor MCM2
LEDEGSGDDLMDNMEADYQAKSEMDRYENEGIDDENDLNELSVQGRMLVDQDLERRE